MPVYKVWSANRQQKHTILAFSLDELKRKGSSKLGIEFDGCQVVDECDGSIVDEDEVLLEMKGTVFLLLAHNQTWTKAKKDNTLNILDAIPVEIVADNSDCKPFGGITVTRVTPIHAGSQNTSSLQSLYKSHDDSQCMHSSNQIEQFPVMQQNNLFTDLIYQTPECTQDGTLMESPQQHPVFNDQKLLQSNRASHRPDDMPRSCSYSLSMNSVNTQTDSSSGHACSCLAKFPNSVFPTCTHRQGYSHCSVDTQTDPASVSSLELTSVCPKGCSVTSVGHGSSDRSRQTAIVPLDSLIRQRSSTAGQLSDHTNSSPMNSLVYSSAATHTVSEPVIKHCETRPSFMSERTCQYFSQSQASLSTITSCQRVRSSENFSASVPPCQPAPRKISSSSDSTHLQLNLPAVQNTSSSGVSRHVVDAQVSGTGDSSDEHRLSKAVFDADVGDDPVDCMPEVPDQGSKVDSVVDDFTAVSSPSQVVTLSKEPSAAAKAITAAANELIEWLKNVLKVEVREDVKARIREERLRKNSFVLLNNDDLRELGFKLGPRLMILHWIKSQKEDNGKSDRSATFGKHISDAVPTSKMVTLSKEPSATAKAESAAVDELVEWLKNVIKVEVREDVKARIREEKLRKSSFVLLNNDDLIELGFKLGPRLMILRWIKSQKEDNGKSDRSATFGKQIGNALPTSKVCSSVVAQPMRSVWSAILGPQPQQSSSASDSRKPSSIESDRNFSRILQNVDSFDPNKIVTCKFQNFPVDKLLSTYQGCVDGSDLVRRLKSGAVYSTRERTFLVRTVGRYLMNHCENQNKPSKVEKMNMAKSIIDVFPILKDSHTGGYKDFYDPQLHAGYLESYVRGRRSRDPCIATAWSCRKRRMPAEQVCHSPTQDDLILSECWSNITNKSEILTLMEHTRQQRREWIAADKPSISQIFEKYPRFQDIIDTVREEFCDINGINKSFSTEWHRYKMAILNLAKEHSSLADFKNEIVDDMDDDTKSFVAFKCLLHLMPSPPKRGIKRPRSKALDQIQYFFSDFDNSPVEEAMQELDRQHEQVLYCSNSKLLPQQLVLFRSQGEYFVKADTVAIAVADVVFLADAVEFLFMCFSVFGVQYPYELRHFYGAFEQMLGMTSTIHPSVTVQDFFRQIKPYLSALSTHD